MDPSSNDINSSESVEDSQPQPAENITYMDVALYEAAAGGKIENFNKYRGFELESLLTPNHNTVLHIYLATDVLSRVLGSDKKYSEFGPFTRIMLFPLTSIYKLILIPSHVKQVQIAKWRFTTSFIKQILDKCPSLLLQPNAKGQTPLHIAARYGHFAIVKFLINRAKAPHGDLERPGMEFEAVRQMLRKTDLESNTALHEAVQYGHLEVVQALLEFEDPDYSYSVNRNEESPLYIAARRGVGATRIILKKKRNLTRETDENGQTPLHYAAHLDDNPSYGSEARPWTNSKKDYFSCPDCCEKVDKRGWNLLHFVAVRHSPLELKLFLEGELGTAYPSIKNLRDEKDARGITPPQVYLASLPGFDRRVRLPFSKNKPSRKQREQIVKLLEDITNEEVAEAPVRRIPIQNEWESLEKAREAHLVVAALIATVTFAAAITVPGGYKSEKGPDQGTPFLIHNTAFQAFVITDALAFIFSLFAIAIHFGMWFPFIPYQYRRTLSFRVATTCLGYALLALVIAFCTGTYAVLQPSPRLAIASCCIGVSIYFLLWVKKLVA
ncbi:protein ACCELERATED CELL DEATH 6-like [Durio zibethinus]|uniref:Protein ACCELERATED CELL DEATH 6-like n=1 Tax=Durio zibethinus TaxID=66656 RepID=A0A6P6A7W1_DURZI|nr:protein ACCELERATED CELL DEATH 6-like [Durio zibethinus]